MLFWIISLLMLALAVLSVLLPLARRDQNEGTDVDAIEIYRDQLKDLERRNSNGEIEGEIFKQERAEIARRILKADRQGSGTKRSQVTSKASRVTASLTALILVPVVSFGSYFYWGSPGVPDHPISAQRLQPLKDKSIEEMVRIAEKHLAKNPDDAKGWTVLSDVYGRLNRPSDRANALQQIIRLSGSTPGRLAELGEALTVANGNIVSARARGLFEQSLAEDPKVLKSSVYLAIAAEQEGKIAKAMEGWRILATARKDDANWQAMTADRIAGLQKKLPADGKIASGPSSEQIASANQLEAGDRTEMINSMVAGLADKLADNPQDLDGWLRLIRSYSVLGRSSDAQTALGDAKKNFQGKEKELERLAKLADQIGLSKREEGNK